MQRTHTDRTAPVAREYDPPAVAQRLREVVELMKVQAEWTQTDFAKKVGIGASRISHYLSGTYYPTLETIARVAGRLGISLEWLVFGVGPMWFKDLGIEKSNEADVRSRVLELASVLTGIADELRKTVVKRKDEEEASKTASEFEALLDRLIAARSKEISRDTERAGRARA